jgi:hypothetical protein
MKWLPSTERDLRGTGGPLLFFHSLNKAGEHPLDFTNAHVKSLLLLLRKESQVARKQQKVFEFARGPERCVQELPKFRPTSPAATLRNVRRHRRGGTPHLAGQTIPLRFGKCGRGRVNPQGEGMALLPNLQWSVILHSLYNQLFIFFSDLQPNTANRQPRKLNSCTGIKNENENVNVNEKNLFISLFLLKTEYWKLSTRRSRKC